MRKEVVRERVAAGAVGGEVERRVLGCVSRWWRGWRGGEEEEADFLADDGDAGDVRGCW